MRDELRFVISATIAVVAFTLALSEFVGAISKALEPEPLRVVGPLVITPEGARACVEFEPGKYKNLTLENIHCGAGLIGTVPENDEQAVMAYSGRLDTGTQIIERWFVQMWGGGEEKER